MLDLIEVNNILTHPISISLVSALAVIDLSSAFPISPLVKLFRWWKEEHNITYDSRCEENNGFDNWKSNLKKIQSKPVDSFTLEMNRFADQSHDEFASKWNGVHLPQKIIKKIKKIKNRSVVVSTGKYGRTYDIDGPKNTDINIDSLPKSVDWRNKGVVNPVKSQLQCGSCWAFSAVGSLESQYALKHKKLISLSEQDLVDCMVNFPTPNGECCDGCGGGWMGASYDFLKQNQAGQDDLESKYTYTAIDGKCKFKQDGPGLSNVTGKVTLKPGSDLELMKAVASIGPISVGVDANWDWQMYESGVYVPDASNGGCSSDPASIDHGVVVVGYDTNTFKNNDGTTSTLSYWIIRNSWDTTWGIDGYMYLSRNVTNACGVSNYATYPLLG